MEGDQGQGEGCRCDGGMFESPSPSRLRSVSVHAIVLC